ncbi:MAG TPA: hypothetical protein VFC42_06670 [Methylomirabilota bacterium]|nr:hypothetical protein [Methylomirabilota bacterium]
MRAALLLLATLGLAAGCGGGARVLAPAAPPDDGMWALRRADALVQAGAAAEATRLLAEAAATAADSPSHDRVLYRLGRLLVDPASPAIDYPQAFRTFDRLVEAHPRSPYAPEARAWRELLEGYLARTQELQRSSRELERRAAELLRATREVERRTQELERLKAIDLQVEQPARRP